MRDDSSELSGPGLFLRANPGLVVLAGMSIVAAWVYFSQKRLDATAVVYELKRAGARVENVAIARGDYLNVNLSGVKVGPRELELLARLPNLRSLDLSRTPVGDAQLHLVAALTPVVDLNLSGTPITGPGLPVLRKLPRLQRLTLSVCAIDDADLPHLAKYPALAELTLAQTGVTDAGLEHLSRLRRLTSLGLASTRVTDAGLPALRELSRLLELDLSATALTDAGLATVCEVAGLQTLRLSSTKISDRGLAHFCRLPTLRRLELTSVAITDAGLRHLAGLTRLEELNVGHTLISDPGVEHLRDLPLRKLILSSTNVTDAGMAAVGGLASLQHLEIDGALLTLPAEMARPEQLAAFLGRGPMGWPSIGDEGVRRIAAARDLRVLRLTGAAVTDDGLAHLASLGSLRRLGLANTLATDAGLRHLRGLAELRSLDLSSTKVAGSAFADPDRLTGLRTLRLAATEFRDENAEHLGRFAGLTTLDLASTPITDATMATVGRLSELQELTLTETAVSDEGLARLKGLKHLQRLNLGQTRVTDAGLAHLRDLAELDEVNAYETMIGRTAAEEFLAKDPPVRILGPKEAEQQRQRRMQAEPGQETPPPWGEPLDPGRIDANGDPLPKGARARLGTMRLFFPGQLADLALTPDGKTLITIGHDRELWLWDTSDGRPRLRIDSGAGGTRGLAVAPDGKRFATCDREGRPHLWETATGKRVRTFDGRGSDWLAFSPDGRRLAVVDPPATLHVFDIESGSPVFTHDGSRGRALMRSGQEQLGAVGFSPDGKLLAANTVRTEVVPCWREVNGRRLRVQMTQQRTAIRTWTWPEGKPLARLSDVANWCGNLAFVAGGRSLVAPGRDGSLIVFDPRTGKKTSRLAYGDKSHGNRIVALPDGKTILVRFRDGWARWDLASGRRLDSLELPGYHLAASADGRMLATCDPGGFLSLWDAAGKELVPLERQRGLAYSRPVAYVSGGKTLATAGMDETVRLWDRASGKPLRMIPTPGWTPSQLAASPEGATLAVALTARAIPAKSLQSRVVVWDAATTRVMFETGQEGWEDAGVGATALSSDGLLAVGRTRFKKGAAAPTGELLLYQTRSGGLLRQLDLGKEVPLAVALSPDAQFVAWETSEGVVLAETASGNEVRRVSLPKPSETGESMQYRLVFSPQGDRLAVGLGSKGVLVLRCVSWDESRTYASPGQYAVESLAYTPAGKLVAAGQIRTPERPPNVSEVAAWDVLSGKQRRPEWKTEQASEMTLSPDGQELATTRAGAMVLLWELTQ